MYNLLYTAEAKEFIQALSVKIRGQIKAACERISIEPTLGKRLTHELTGMWSYRSGDYRIIYRVEQQKLVIIILAVGDRKNVYGIMTRRRIHK